MLKISRDETSSRQDPEIGYLGQLVALVFPLLCLPCCGLHTASIFALWDHKGNDINSRKKHEREVMRLAHEHNRLDQRNLVSCARFYLQTAGTSVGDKDEPRFSRRLS